MILPAAKGSDLKGRAQPRIYKRRGRSDPQSIVISILQTLKYSNHFSFPLSLSEIHLRLISSDPCLPAGRLVSLERVIGTLRLMLKKHLLQKTGDFYHLPGRSSLVARRHRRQKLSAPQHARAKTLVSHLSSLPFILAIYLTGSLAMSNSGKNSDIDFMVITQSSRLWTTRLLLTLYTSLLGLRRTPGSTKNTGKLCLNLYLTPKTYHLPLTKQNLYTAYELVQTIPLYDPSGTHSSLLSANPWIRDLLPNFQLPVAIRSDLVGCKSNQKPTRSDLVGIIEYICYHFQLAYMRPKLTREHITPDSAFFHPHDPSPRGLSLKGIVSKV